MDFKNYWYQGKAEVASYKLEQARYGEMRDGHAVLVFVTEDFSKSKQVKLDNSQRAGKDKGTGDEAEFCQKIQHGHLSLLHHAVSVHAHPGGAVPPYA